MSSGDAAAPSDVVINGVFWLQQGRDLVLSSIPTVRAQAERLVTSAAWLWSVYAATVLVATGLEQFQDLPALAVVLLVLPVPLLCAAYALAVLAQGPVYSTLDPRVPADVQQADATLLVVARRRLHAALWALACSAGCVGVGAVVALLVPR